MTRELKAWLKNAFRDTPPHGGYVVPPAASLKPVALALCDDTGLANGHTDVHLRGGWNVSGGTPQEQEFWIELETGQVLLLWLGVPRDDPTTEPRPAPPRLVLQTDALEVTP